MSEEGNRPPPETAHRQSSSTAHTGATGAVSADVSAATNARWDLALQAIPIYTPYEFRKWEDNVRAIFVTRHADWLLAERRLGDERANGMALVTLQKALACGYQHLSSGITSTPELFKENITSPSAVQG